jgi:hypothetical protein
VPPQRSTFAHERDFRGSQAAGATQPWAASSMPILSPIEGLRADLRDGRQRC